MEFHVLPFFSPLYMFDYIFTGYGDENTMYILSNIHNFAI
jgi:hypothetical protein